MHKNTIWIMTQKTERLNILKQIIELNRISTQEELLEILKQRGFNTTQATLSRDLKLLKVIKIPDIEYSYVYALPGNYSKKQVTGKQTNFSKLGFHSMVIEGNLSVIKTKSGYANSFASIVDELEIPGVLGTIAGNDTILMVLKKDLKYSDLKNSLIIGIPELKDYLK